MYIYVILLLILVFLLLKDNKIKSIEEIKSKIDNIDKKIEDVIKKSCVCDIQCVKEENLTKEYIILKNECVNLNENILKTLVANYILQEGKVCGFNLRYVVYKKANMLNKIYAIGINYLLLFQKNNIESYGVIILKKEELEKYIKENTKLKIVPFVSDEEILKCDITKQNINKLKKMYIKSLKYIDFNMIIKTILLIVIGSAVTANLIYSFINLDYTNYMNFVTAIIIYYCYSYILNYIYKPLGRYKMFVKYVFPIYILIFIVITIVEGVIRFKR